MKTSLSILALCALAAPSMWAASDYGTNYAENAVITNSARTLNAVKLISPSDGSQTIESSQAADRALFHDRTAFCFSATAGESVTVNFDWTGTWMHGYVYIDRDNDGAFDAPDGAGRDVMSFSNYDGVNSLGAATNNGNVGVNPPAFTVPDLPTGLYRMRLKVDWNSIDPGGNLGDNGNGVGNNTILTNGGAITDVMIYIHDGDGHISVSAENGSLNDLSGNPISPESIQSGRPLTVVPVADGGYAFDALTVTSGYDCGSSDVSFANSQLELNSTVIPAFALTDGAITIPAALLCGDVTIEASFLPSSQQSADGDYAVDTRGDKDPAKGITGLNVNGVRLDVNSSSRYCFLSGQAVPVKAGEPFAFTADYVGSAAPLKLFVDHGQDGNFSAIEGGMSSDLLGLVDGSDFTIHSMLSPGVYRARVVAEGDCTVDFLLNVHAESGALDVKAMNGNVLSADGSALPLTATFATDIPIKPMTVLPGFTASEIIVRHGHNLNGPAYVKGNRQWQDTVLPIKNGKIPAELVDGDVDIYVIYNQSAASKWVKVWGDEFNGNEIDPKRWQYQKRQGATWNRLVAQGDEIPLVNVVEDGRYKSYCIPTPAEFGSTETQPMISGAINSQGLFHLTYGRIEARIRTTRHTGNFPAFWMMPMDQSMGWPKDGEIDIWEQIDESQTTYHTVHSGWTYKSFGDVAQSTPQSGGTGWADHDLWHVFALEWDAEQLRWYVDGQQVFAYNNSHYSDGGSYTENVTWPFYKDFYIIINQSVGNGSWAKPCDTSFTYLTEFDWVRVYKKVEDDGFTTSIDHNGDDPDFYVKAEDDPSAITDVVINDGSDDESSVVEYFDMRGCRVADTSQSGIYIRRCGNTVTKILKR